MTRKLKINKGVHVHTFFDGSGCVLFNEVTGETLGFTLSIDEIIQRVNDEDQTNIQYMELSTLISKGFVV